MKLIRFSQGDSKPRFGVVIADRAIAFATLLEIDFERIGTLRCRFAEPLGKLLPSRWPLRPALQKFHVPSKGTASADSRQILS